MRLGVVSFLNARPLIAGLVDDPCIEPVFDVPARLPVRLEQGEVEVALVPIIDVLRIPGRYRVVSNACIGSDGETMTVRVFSRVPPDRLRRLAVDTHSHTSVALVQVLWRELYDRDLELEAVDVAATDLDRTEAVLLIGDKVVDPQRGSFGYEVDLGGAWHHLTGLPFVFAVWAALAERVATEPSLDELGEILNAARDRGVADAARIAAAEGPALGWPVLTARRYLTRCLRFVLDQRAVDGVNLFARNCAAANLVPIGSRLESPLGGIKPEATTTT